MYEPKPRQLINSASEIPQSFASEDEEREWWATHDFSDAFYDESREGVERANLELKLMRLSWTVKKLSQENDELRRRLEQLEARR